MLLDLGAAHVDIVPWSDRVQYVNATCAGAWELPVLGDVAAPAAVLLRPDGYVAWVGDGTPQGLTDAHDVVRRACDSLVAVEMRSSIRSKDVIIVRSGLCLLEGDRIPFPGPPKAAREMIEQRPRRRKGP